MSWKQLRQGEDKAEVALNTDEPDERNNGKTHVDDVCRLAWIEQLTQSFGA